MAESKYTGDLSDATSGYGGTEQELVLHDVTSQHHVMADVKINVGFVDDVTRPLSASPAFTDEDLTKHDVTSRNQVMRDVTNRALVTRYVRGTTACRDVTSLGSADSDVARLECDSLDDVW